MKVLFVAGRWAQELEEKAALENVAELDMIVPENQEQLAEKAKDAEIVITSYPVSAQVMRAAKKLKMIQVTSVGYENIDMDGAAENGIVVCNVAEANADSVAELAFAPGTGQVAPNFIVPDSGQSLQVMLDFGQVQPNSNYKYEECLKVTNNKPYSVDLYVDNVSGNILSLLPNAQLEIWGSDSPWPWMWENIPGSSTRYPATASNFYTIPAYGTTYISFRLTTSYYATGGTYTGTVTFYAWRWQSR